MSLIDHYNPEAAKSQMNWAGLQSGKFGKTKQLFSRHDFIGKGFDVPSQTVARGRKHFSEHNSPEKQFRSILRIIPPIQHWHPRKSNKKILQTKLSEPHARRERSHHIPEFQSAQRSLGIRTFYNNRARDKISKEFMVEDMMQRRRKIDHMETKSKINRTRQRKSMSFF